MFTGLVEEIGVIKSLTRQSNNLHITVKASLVLSDLKIDDSISINGACQTVVKRTEGTFDVTAVDETLRKTTFSDFAVGGQVNLERAVKVGDRLGGHLVQGHVDCVGLVSKVDAIGGSRQVWIEFPTQFSRYVVPIGSICINGVSLTVARVEGNMLMVAIIPHTLDVTTLGMLKAGTRVNLEFDILGKYIEKMMMTQQIDLTKSSVLQSWVTQPDI